MAKKFIDLRGLSRVTANFKYYVQKLLVGKADTTLGNVTDDTIKAKVDAADIVTTTGTGAAYKATVPGIKNLTAGASFIMIPHINSTSSDVTLNVNGLGAKPIRQPLTTNTAGFSMGIANNWLRSGHPTRVTYTGSYWYIDRPRPSANSIYGKIPIENGGTNADNAEDARKNLGFTPPATYQLYENFQFDTVTVKGAWSAVHLLYIFEFCAFVQFEEGINIQLTVPLAIARKSLDTTATNIYYPVNMYGRETYFLIAHDENDIKVTWKFRNGASSISKSDMLLTYVHGMN